MAIWSKILRHGSEPTIAELENFTFQSVVFDDGTILQNVTFDQLTEQVWNLVNKSSASTLTNATRN